jgi:short subunit dehydrogenase-like uncharacterized protein
MDQGFIKTDILAIGERGTRVWARVAMRGDPGNRATVCFAVQAALHLCADVGVGRGGVLTPALALGAGYAARLRDHGVTCEVVK